MGQGDNAYSSFDSDFYDVTAASKIYGYTAGEQISLVGFDWETYANDYWLVHDLENHSTKLNFDWIGHDTQVLQLDGLWEVHTAKLGNPDDQQNNVDAEFEAAELLFYLDPAISGTQDDDELAGNERDNVIIGFSGNDKISGGAGDDVLYGGDGIDELSGNDGSNILDGGRFHDRAKFNLGITRS